MRCFAFQGGNEPGNAFLGRTVVGNSGFDGFFGDRCRMSGEPGADFIFGFAPATG